MKEHNANDTSAYIRKNMLAHPKATRAVFALFALAVLALFIWGIVSLVLVFFSVEEIEVRGDAPYSSDELIYAVGIEKGDRLYYLGADKKEKQLLDSFPYLESVEIKSYFPNRVVIEAQALDLILVTKHESGYCALDKDFLVLEVAQSISELSGARSIFLDTLGTFSGEVGQIGESEEKSLLADVFAGLEDFERFDEINKIIVRDRHNISFVFAGNCRIVLGNTQNANEKVSLALKIYNSGDFDRENYSIIDVSNEKKALLRYVDKENFEK